MVTKAESVAVSSAPLTVASKPLLPPMRTLPDMFNLKSNPPSRFSFLKPTQMLGPGFPPAPPKRTAFGIGSTGEGKYAQASAFRYVLLSPPKVIKPVKGGSVKKPANEGKGVQLLRLVKLTDPNPMLGSNAPKTFASKPPLPPKLR